MTEQEAKELQVGDVVEHRGGRKFIVIATKRNALPIVVECGKYDSHADGQINLSSGFDVFSQVVSRQGRSVKKL